MQVRYALYPQLEPRQVTTDYSHVGMRMWRIHTGSKPCGSRGPVSSTCCCHHARASTDGAGHRSEYRRRDAAPMAMERPPVEVAPADSDCLRKCRRLDACKSVQPIAASRSAASMPRRWCSATPRARVLQAGPGIPAWRYNSYGYYWTGPVEIRRHGALHLRGPGGAVLLAPPRRGRRWSCCSCGWRAELRRHGLAPGALRIRLRQRCRASRRCCWWRWSRCGIAGGAGAGGGRRHRRAQPSCSPSSRARLTAAPACAPDCAEISAARVVVDGDRLEVMLQVSALATRRRGHAACQRSLAARRSQRGCARLAGDGARATTPRCGCRSPPARTPCGSRAGSRPPNPSSSRSRSRRASST